MHKLYLGRWACCAYVPNRPFLIWKTQDSERYLSLFYFYSYNNSTVWVGYTKRWWPTVKQRPYSYQFSSRPSILFAHTTYIELRQVHNNRNVMLIVGAHKHTRRTWSCFLLSFQYYFPCAFCCTLGENQLSIYQKLYSCGYFASNFCPTIVLISCLIAVNTKPYLPAITYLCFTTIIIILLSNRLNNSSSPLRLQSPYTEYKHIIWRQ